VTSDEERSAMNIPPQNIVFRMAQNRAHREIPSGIMGFTNLDSVGDMISCGSTEDKRRHVELQRGGGDSESWSAQGGVVPPPL
jgi:hypothetical protein